MQPLYTAVKVNNEIELCEITDMEGKQLIERALLKQRISYFIRWPKPSIFRRNRNACIICVHDDAREVAEEVVRSICDEYGYTAKFILKKAQNDYL